MKTELIQNPAYSENEKKKFDPLLEGSWCEFFKIIKDNGVPGGVIWVPNFGR